MLPSHLTEYLLTLRVLLFILEIRSQSIQFEVDDQPNRPSAQSPSSCDTSNSCIRIRTSSFKSIENWRKVGITCGVGKDMHRLKCCLNTTGSVREVSPVTPNNLNNFSRAECGQSRVGNVNHGNANSDAEEGAWPWMVAIRLRRRNGLYKPRCTGFLIDKRHVISAAHCFRNSNAENYITRIGRVNQDEGYTYKVARIVEHEEYRGDWYYHDIAILTLTRDVDFPGFNPICLPDESIVNQDLVGYRTTVAGWGSVTLGVGTSFVLRESRQIPVISNTDCNNILQRKYASGTFFEWPFPRGIYGGFICAGFIEGDKDNCEVDSGAPLMLQKQNTWFVVGSLSLGFDCGMPGVPIVYTRISYYLDWIRQNTRDWNEKMHA